jgi:DNA-binding NarL/FixJ family response regulator
VKIDSGERMTDHSTILIVDASPLVRSSAGRMIRNAFPELEMLEADRLSSALRKVQHHRPAMVITDIHLKEGSGLKLTEAVEAWFPETTVVVFTNEDGPEYEAEALSRGADFFISKAESGGRAILEVIRSCPPGRGCA